jgi:hypothetical protein
MYPFISSQQLGAVHKGRLSREERGKKFKCCKTFFVNSPLKLAVVLQLTLDLISHKVFQQNIFFA